MRRHRYSAIVALLATISFNLGNVLPAHGGEKPAYNFGVFPHLPPTELEKIFAPIAAELGKALERPVHFRSATTFANFREQLESEQFDIVFVQPFDYVYIADRFGYRALATRDEELKAILIVKPDSDIKTVQDLKGRKIALPPRTAAVSHLVIDYFNKQGIAPDSDVRLDYHRSHVSCMQQVLIAAADACGTAAPTLRYFEHRMKTKMRVVAKTDPIPHALFATHPRVSSEEREKLLRTIESWRNTPQGKELLQRGRLTPFKHIADSDYDVVRAMLKKK